MTIDFKSFIELVPNVTSARFPILMRGRHGIGKSQVVYQVAKTLELPAILTVTPKYVAKKVFKAQQKNIEEMYIPGIWLLIMFIIKLIPEKIFKNLNI